MSVQTLQFENSAVQEKAGYSDAQKQWTKEFAALFHSVFSTHLFPKRVTWRLFAIPEDSTWSLIVLTFATPEDAMTKVSTLLKCAKNRQLPSEKDYKEFIGGKGSSVHCQCLPRDQKLWDILRLVGGGHMATYEKSRLLMKEHKCQGVFIHVYCPRIDDKDKLFDAAASLVFRNGDASMKAIQQAYSGSDYELKKEVKYDLPKMPEDAKGAAVVKEWCARVAPHPTKGPEAHELWQLQKTVCRGCLKTKTELQMESFVRCAGCKSANYCSKECQRAHWQSSHRELCTAEASCAYFAADVFRGV